MWGADAVGARDPGNGLEDATMKQWNYWDGQIIKGKDSKYHLFACRWDQAAGHKSWHDSKAVHAVSDTVAGPYIDKGLCWPDNMGGKGHSIYPAMEGLPKHDLHNLEDPAVWYSGGIYHIVVNNWSDRVAYHMTFADGINNWIYRGVAYDPRKDIVRYPDGTVNHWEKMERPGVLLENGHVTALTLAVLDVPKDSQKGNDGHGSKIVVIPFDGASLDRDLAASTAVK